MADLLLKVTDKRSLELDAGLIRRIKSLCKKSDEHIRTVHDFTPACLRSQSRSGIAYVSSSPLNGFCMLCCFHLRIDSTLCLCRPMTASPTTMPCTHGIKLF